MTEVKMGNVDLVKLFGLDSSPVEAPEGWKIGNPDWPAGDGPYLVRPDDDEPEHGMGVACFAEKMIEEGEVEPSAPSPRFGGRLRAYRAKVDGEDEPRSCDVVAEDLDALADAIDADRREQAFRLGLKRGKERSVLRRRIEEAVERLKYTSLVAGTQLLRDVVDYDELLAALVDILGPTTPSATPPSEYRWQVGPVEYRVRQTHPSAWSNGAEMRLAEEGKPPGEWYRYEGAEITDELLRLAAGGAPFPQGKP